MDIVTRKVFTMIIRARFLITQITLQRNDHSVSKLLKQSLMRLLQFLNEQTFNLTSLECRAIWSLNSESPVFSDFFEKHCSNLEMLTLDNWESYMESGNYSKKFIKFISSMVSINIIINHELWLIVFLS